MTTAAQAKWMVRVTEMQTLRKLPGHCVRCGKPHDGEKKTCQKCLDYIADKQRLDKAKLLHVLRRVESLETAVARIETTHKLARNRAYSKGYVAGLRNGLQPTHYEPPTMSVQEHATMHHKYTR